MDAYTYICTLQRPGIDVCGCGGGSCHRFTATADAAACLLTYLKTHTEKKNGIQNCDTTRNKRKTLVLLLLFFLLIPFNHFFFFFRLSLF